MKKLICLFIAVGFTSCKCKQETTTWTPIVDVTSECPKDGTCTAELIRNKSMTVKQDEFGSTYYTLEESDSKSVVKYTYTRTVKGDVQDANYREEIVFETSSQLNENLNISGEALQNKNLLFGRFCFCRGQTGYYKINDGNLTITNGRVINLDFKADKVPQIIKHITINMQ